MFKLVEWNDSLDLSSFYKKASERGFVNNSSKEMLIDCFKNEKKFNAWILYKDNDPVGSVAAHSLDILGNKAYRICSRSCAFPEYNPNKGLSSKRISLDMHQNFISQFFIPIGIEWAGVHNDLYISSHPSNVGSQKLIHNVFCPIMEDNGVLTKHSEMFYRGHVQTFWKINSQEFKNQYGLYPKWV